MNATTAQAAPSELPTTRTLELALQGTVLRVTLNRPDNRNAMSLEMVNELSQVLQATADNAAIRAIVLRGKGGHFCAGGDIKDMAAARAQAGQATQDEDPFFILNRRFGELICQADKQPQVLIAVLEGAVLGGGFGLACVSDVAIAAADAQFGLPETGLGVIPAQIAPFVVQRVGLTQARRLTLLGERFNGAEAQRIGLVHFVGESVDDLETHLHRVLDQVKRCAPHANRVTKDLILRIGHEPLTELLDDAARSFAQAVRSSEGSEGTMAFIQKRLPAWAQDPDQA